ncbi:hypothetical protein [Frankia sp. R82]|uniref:hypothetical protein n=1 Tax=Frankia sp. R82 TaxID=2950553 RepID=UPI0020446258|nr:hypothetical protein [Frankia sp. R82]MCM3887008.1 hypothetical protein [Frankia sp. R82]
MIGAGADGWWRDRSGAARRLLAAISAWLDDCVSGSGSPALSGLPIRIVVVLEGAARAGHPAGPVAIPVHTERETHGIRPGRPVVEVVHAPGHGDDAIVAATRAAGPGTLVATSDRALGDRVRALGAETRGARWLRDTIGL